MSKTKKLEPKEVRIISDLDWLDIEDLDAMPDFEFKMPEPVKKEGRIQVVRPTKKNSRIKELF